MVADARRLKAQTREAGEGAAHHRLAGEQLPQPHADQRAADRADAEGAEHDAVGQGVAFHDDRARPAAAVPAPRRR